MCMHVYGARHVCVCESMCMQVYGARYVCVWESMCMHVYGARYVCWVCECMRMNMWMNIYIYMKEYMYVYVYVYVWVYLCVWVHVYVWMYKCAECVCLSVYECARVWVDESFLSFFCNFIFNLRMYTCTSRCKFSRIYLCGSKRGIAGECVCLCVWCVCVDEYEYMCMCVCMSTCYVHVNTFFFTCT